MGRVVAFDKPVGENSVISMLGKGKKGTVTAVAKKVLVDKTENVKNEDTVMAETEASKTVKNVKGAKNPDKPKSQSKKDGKGATKSTAGKTPDRNGAAMAKEDALAHGKKTAGKRVKGGKDAGEASDKAKSGGGRKKKAKIDEDEMIEVKMAPLADSGALRMK